VGIADSWGRKKICQINHHNSLGPVGRELIL